MAKRCIFPNLIEARQRQANRYVNGYLLSLDDETLAQLGRKRKDLIKSAAYPSLF